LASTDVIARSERDPLSSQQESKALFGEKGKKLVEGMGRGRRKYMGGGRAEREGELGTRRRRGNYLFDRMVLSKKGSRKGYRGGRRTWGGRHPLQHFGKSAALKITNRSQKVVSLCGDERFEGEPRQGAGRKRGDQSGVIHHLEEFR